jgi:hypothetical protein
LIRVGAGRILGIGASPRGKEGDDVADGAVVSLGPDAVTAAVGLARTGGRVGCRRRRPHRPPAVARAGSGINDDDTVGSFDQEQGGQRPVRCFGARAVAGRSSASRIRAGDYLFDADVTGAGSTVAFTNSSDNQFHHVVVMDFATNDPALVEENLPAIVESEGEGPPPEGIDVEQVNFEFAFSPVFGPGSSGTFEAPFEEGHTYAVMCFIQDRDGGLPHVLQHQMYDVFQVGAA